MTLADGDALSICVDEDFSNEGIQQLLKEAEERLRAREAPGPVSLPTSARVGPAVAGSAVAGLSKARRIRVPATLPQPYIRSNGELVRVDDGRLVDPQSRRLAQGVRKVQDPIQIKDKAKEKKATAGSDWFDLPKTDLTPELKRDLQLLQMRSVLDPKRHYKKSNKSKGSLVPDYSQVGTIVEGPTEFFSGRIPKKERKQTFVEEVLAKDDNMNRFKHRYNDVQVAKTSGKRAYYQQLKAKRAGKFRTR